MKNFLKLTKVTWWVFVMELAVVYIPILLVMYGVFTGNNREFADIFFWSYVKLSIFFQDILGIEIGIEIPMELGYVPTVNSPGFDYVPIVNSLGLFLIVGAQMLILYLIAAIISWLWYIFKGKNKDKDAVLDRR